MSRTVLILESGLGERVDLAAAFEAVGFHAVPCGQAAAARDALSHARVDAVILDGRLADQAADLLHEIRSTPWGKVLPVVMLAPEGVPGERLRDLDRGPDEYVPRPYEPRHVVARVGRLVGGPRPPGGTTILIIDDSPTFRLLLSAALSDAGYAVLEAEAGEDGLLMAGARRPDALVVDGVLPGIDGPAVIRQLRLDAALRDTPCLLLTSSDDPDAELRALDAGADAFVRKQDDLTYLLARVAAMLRSAPARPVEVAATRSLTGLRKIMLVAGAGAGVQWLSDALTGDGYDVMLVGSGPRAIELLATQPVDCILLDLLMPGMSGPEICARVKAVPALRDIPLIMLTVAADQRATAEALGAGADDCIATSSEPAILRARIRAQIRRKQFEDENRRVREALLRRELEALEARAAREMAETKAILVDELERKNRELEAFSYSVSHDLRAPLRAIDGFSRVVLEDHGARLPADGRDALERVCAAARRMGELIDALLELSRVGRASLRRTYVDLSGLAREVVADLRDGSDHQVEIVVADGLMATADVRLIRIVLVNLLRNAWKFTARTAAPRIEVGRAGEEEGGPAFFVRDNGAGFDMAYVERLFRPFQRLHAEREFAGTGIGLATVHRIIDRHGGRVRADARPGAGATFTFTLPAPPQGGLP